VLWRLSLDDPPSMGVGGLDRPMEKHDESARLLRPIERSVGQHGTDGGSR